MSWGTDWPSAMKETGLARLASTLMMLPMRRVSSSLVRTTALYLNGSKVFRISTTSEALVVAESVRWISAGVPAASSTSFISPSLDRSRGLRPMVSTRIRSTLLA